MAAGLFGQHPGVSFGRELRRQSQAWAGDLMAAETNRQVNNARAELIRQSDQLAAQMEKNSANPSQWLTDFEAQQDQIQTAVLGQTSLPGAERYVRDMLATQMADLRATIRERADKQMAKNADTDFNIGLDKYNDTSNIRDMSDLLRNLEAGLSHIAGGWNNGESPVDSLPTEMTKNAMEKALTQKMVGDFVVRQAVETGNMALIKNANAIARDELGMEEELFTPKEIDDLIVDANRMNQFKKVQAEELSERQIQVIHNLAIKSMQPKKEGEIQVTPEYVRAKIDQSDGLTPQQKTEAWKQYNEAITVRAKTGQNPYTTTQDWNAAMEAYWKAEQGIAPDPQDVGRKYDIQWYEKLKEIAKAGGTAKDFEDSKAAKFLKELVEDWGRRYNFYEQIPVMREKGYRLLQDAIQSAEKPLTDREKQELALRIFNGLQTEPITSAPGALLTPFEKAEQLGRELDIAVAENIAARRRGVSTSPSIGLPMPQTQEEYEALSSGTRYRHPDGTIRIKR